MGVCKKTTRVSIGILTYEYQSAKVKQNQFKQKLNPLRCEVCVCVSCSVMTDSATPWTVCSPPGSSVHEILQARILEWVAIPFSRGFPDPGNEPWSPALQADSLLSEPAGKPKFAK